MEDSDEPDSLLDLFTLRFNNLLKLKVLKLKGPIYAPLLRSHIQTLVEQPRTIHNPPNLQRKAEFDP